MPSTDTSDREVRESIASYDALASRYAERYEAINFADYRSDFVGRLATTRGTILDAGCGPGRDSVAFAQAGLSVISLDLSAAFLQFVAIAGLSFPVRADMRWLPLASRSVDGVWMCASLVHLAPTGVRQALSEARRVLANGGVLFCCVPAGRGEEWRPDPGGGRRWFHYFDEHEITSLVSDAGFRLQTAVTADGVARGRWINVFAELREP